MLLNLFNLSFLNKLSCFVVYGLYCFNWFNLFFNNNLFFVKFNNNFGCHLNNLLLFNQNNLLLFNQNNLFSFLQISNLINKCFDFSNLSIFYSSLLTILSNSKQLSVLLNLNNCIFKSILVLQSCFDTNTN